MKRTPIPRQQIYDLYWYFASERHQIFERRLGGQPAPWTNDPILLKYKFCNVFRATDRVSQYMIREVCYHTEGCSPQDRLFQIVAFRLFSKIETWNAVRDFLGHSPTIRNLIDGTFTKALEYAHEANGGLYTNAFILCATNAYGQPRKYLTHIELLRDMFVNHNLADQLLEASSLKEIYTLLRTFPLMGDFMSYQMAIDLNYSDLINFSENDFTQPGPGAIRGLKKVFESLGDYSPAEAVLWMVERQNEEFTRLNLPPATLFGRPLQAIDCQNVLCETDKYCREAVPELASARSRIKTTYGTPKPIDALFLPPKWKIDTTQ
jgi:hypothetical protein